MKRLVLASCAVLLVLAPVLAQAQSRTPPSGGTSAGSASPRGGDSGGSSAPSGSSGSATERGGSSGSSGPGGGSYSSPVSGGGSVRTNYAGPRSGETRGVARPRDASSSVGQPVPASERARGDRPLYGQAVPRTVPSGGNNNRIVISGGYPYYDPYFGNGYYGGYYYGYNPYYWDAWAMPYGWGMYSWPMAMYSGYWYDYATGASYTTSAIGSIKLKVKPKDAEVYVDGTFYGKVDDYDGAFQHLDLSPGTHRVEMRATGFETLQIEMRVLPGKTVTYSGEMKPAK